MATELEHKLELGLDTFGDVTSAADGTALPHARVIRNVIDEGVLADQLGIDFFGLGEHHRADFAVSAPEVVLAAIAARTNAFASAQPSRCSAPMILSGCFSDLPRWTALRTAVPK